MSLAQYKAHAPFTLLCLFSGGQASGYQQAIFKGSDVQYTSYMFEVANTRADALCPLSNSSVNNVLIADVVES